MAWVWTDEIAVELARAGIADTIVGELVTAPIGFAVPDGEDPVRWAAEVLGVSLEETGTPRPSPTPADLGPGVGPAGAVDSSL